MISGVPTVTVPAFYPRPNLQADRNLVPTQGSTPIEKNLAPPRQVKKSEAPEPKKIEAKNLKEINEPKQSDAKTLTNAAGLAQLSEAEKDQVAQLKKIDREVRAHEQAHKNAGGQYAGSASFGYQVGPDGRRYAVSGEVSIDIAPIEGDPEATIAKLNAVISAALAPAKPSGQDRHVAAIAVALRAEARQTSRAEKSGSKEGNSITQNAINSPAIAAYATANSIANPIANFGENNANASGNVLNFFS